MSKIRKTKNSIKQLFVPGMLFEDMGITYLGPVDGHDIKKLYRTFKEAQKMEHAVLVHVLTQKGRGSAPAEQSPSKFHGVSPFNLETGKTSEVKKTDTYTDVFGKIRCQLGEKEPKLIGITAAMKDGTGLSAFQKCYPERFFDVGIAEQHAVTFAGGLAAAGLKPVFAVYSAFLQRGYDQIVHDICMQNLPVIFAIDRAGLVGNDGETHQGVYDIAYLGHIPNMTILAPKNRWELEDMMAFAVAHNGPIAIRYPRGVVYEGLETYRDPISLGKSEAIYQESDIAILSVGHMMETSEKVYDDLKAKGYRCSLINSRFIKPIDTAMLDTLLENHQLLVTIEDAVICGGFGESVESYVSKRNPQARVLVNGVPDQYVEHGNIPTLRKSIGLDADSIVAKIESGTKDVNSSNMSLGDTMKERLDVLLVKRNLTESREKAKAIIMSGNVFVEGQREDKAGSTFSDEVQIEIKGHTLPYVSRGGLKLEKAVANFDVLLQDKVCTDVGSSTGGFTDCMLQNGARKVFAIDVGRGQLAWKLRQDERVVCMEKTNIRYVTPEDLGEPIDFSSIDVSFISLTKVLLPIRNYLKEDGQIVALIKPQFEAGREKVGKKGVVRDKSTHYEVIEMVLSYAVSIGFSVLNLDFSPIKGPEGNIEYLAHLQKSNEAKTLADVKLDWKQVVEAAFDTLAN